MKRLLYAVATLIVCSIPSMAGVVYDSNLTNGSVVADTNYPLSCYSNNIDELSFQAVYSTVTFGNVLISTPNINTTTEVITTTQAYTTGFSLLLTTSGFTGGGLTNNTTYFAISYSATGIQLATTKALAIAGTAINITTGTASSFAGTLLLTPTNIVVTSPFSFKWQASNDNTNWTDLSGTSITIVGTTGNTSSLWDFGVFHYRHIRAALLSGSLGAINLKLRGYGKRTNP